jgi:hypothetical protein
MTLYMQNVLGYSPIEGGLAYLPVTVGVGLSAGISAQLFGRIGTRPVIVAGTLLAAGGMFSLSRLPDDGSYVSDLLPGLVVTSLGLGAVFVSVTTATTAGLLSTPGADRSHALTAGYRDALLACSILLLAAAGFALRTANARGEDRVPVAEPPPDPAVP